MEQEYPCAVCLEQIRSHFLVLMYVLKSLLTVIVVLYTVVLSANGVILEQCEHVLKSFTKIINRRGGVFQYCRTAVYNYLASL